MPGAWWFAAALVPMVTSQVARLFQSDPAAWLLFDYAGRGGALIILAAIPAARRVAFSREKLAISYWVLPFWVISFFLVNRFIGDWIRHFAYAGFRGAGYAAQAGWIYGLGKYPDLDGWVRVFDLSVGLALVAYTEETIFRRCVRHVFRPALGTGFSMIIASSMIFALYHWWTGIGNIVAVFCLGVFAMVFYQRSKALFPVVLGHYITDVVDFA